MGQFERQFFEYFQILDRKFQYRPMVLGGITYSGGGTGSPPGGYIGQLPQVQVCYDLSEEATDYTPPSGESLIDNLNHIRNRIQTLEAYIASGSGGGSTSVAIYDDGILQGGVNAFDFTTNISATVAANKVTVVSTDTIGRDQIVVIYGAGYGYYPTKTYTADSTGLQDAIDESIDLDIIFIPPGEYTIDPIDFSTKNVSMIGAGSGATLIYITGGASDLWLINLTRNSYDPKTFVGIRFYLESYSTNSGGLMGFSGAYANQVVMYDIILEGYGVGGSCPASTTFYGLYTNGGDDVHGTDQKFILKDVDIFLLGYKDPDITYIGAGLNETHADGLRVFVENYWGDDVYGVILSGAHPNGSILSNSFIRVARTDDSTNGRAVGIEYAADSHIINTYIDLYNYSDSANSENTETMILYQGQGGKLSQGIIGGNVFNVTGRLEVDTTDATKCVRTASYYAGTPYGLVSHVSVLKDCNFTIKTNRSIGTPATCHHVYMTSTSYAYVDLYNCSFASINENDSLASYATINNGSIVRKYDTSFDGIIYSRNGAYLGDYDNGNYVTITETGIRLYGTATDFDDLRIDGLSTRIGIVAPTDEVGFRGNSNFYSRNFVHTQADEVQFNVQFPHSWKEQSVIYPHVHFSPWISGSGTQSAKFILEYYWANHDDQFPVSTSTYDMQHIWTDDKQWYHFIASGSGGITATSKEISSIMKCRLYRDNTVADNLAGKVTFLYFDIHVEDNSIGSGSQYTK